jgi:hypothetical protein
MKNKVFYLVALAVGMVFVMSGCKDCDDPSDPDCGNYDPCFGKYPDKLEIEMYCSDVLVEPYRSSHFHKTERNEFISPRTFQFKVNYDYDSVVWSFSGSNQTWTNKELELRFSSNDSKNPLTGDFTATFVGYRPTDPLCKGEKDRGIDTLTRSFTLVDWRKSRILGHYRGLNNGETDSVDFFIFPDTLRHDNGTDFWVRYIVAVGLLPKSYSNEEGYGIKFPIIAHNYSFRQGNSQNVLKPILTKVKGFLINDDEIVVEWTTITFYGYDGIQRTFKGKRIK